MGLSGDRSPKKLEDSGLLTVPSVGFDGGAGGRMFWGAGRGIRCRAMFAEAGDEKLCCGAGGPGSGPYNGCRIADLCYLT